VTKQSDEGIGDTLVSGGVACILGLTGYLIDAKGREPSPSWASLLVRGQSNKPGSDSRIVGKQETEDLGR
jgi:hypothetical protein